MLELNQVHQGNCYSLLAAIPAGSVSAIITDLPYNTTSCAWDKQPIDLPALWQEVKRILVPGGAFVTTAAQPFTTTLINSNREWFRYELIYKKNRPSDFLNANRRPMRIHENVLIFCERRTTGTYNPQKTAGKPYVSRSRFSNTEVYRPRKPKTTENLTGDRHPTTVLDFAQPNSERGLHPTQKPTALYRWLVKTYTNLGDLVLDPFAGSGTTGVACALTGRGYILIEREEKYAEIARARLAEIAARGTTGALA